MFKTWRSWLGYSLLIAALPLALFGSLMDANEFRAQGIAGIDCDGPLSVLLFAVPALLIFGGGAVFLVIRHPRPISRVIALACGLICLPIALNILDAVEQSRLAHGAETCRATG